MIDGSLTTDRERGDMRCYRPEDEQRYRNATLTAESAERATQSAWALP